MRPNFLKIKGKLKATSYSNNRVWNIVKENSLSTIDLIFKMLLDNVGSLPKYIREPLNHVIYKIHCCTLELIISQLLLIINEGGHKNWNGILLNKEFHLHFNTLSPI